MEIMVEIMVELMIELNAIILFKELLEIPSIIKIFKVKQPAIVGGLLFTFISL